MKVLSTCLKRVDCCLVSVFIVWTVTAASPRTHDEESVMLVRLFPHTMEQWEQLTEMDLDIVSEIASPKVSDALIGPSRLSEIEKMGIRAEILMDGESVRQALARATEVEQGAAFDPEFHTYEEVGAELDSLAQAYPGIAMVDSIGRSTQEGRTIWAFKISDNVHTEEDEPAVLYDGVHHACEVMGLEICMYMINHLLSNYGSDPTVTSWVDNTEIWFIPLLNPDGHFAVTSEISLFWRKNGRDHNENGILYEYMCDDWWTCRTEGVDVNRNYDFNWQNGGSGDPWNHYYRGSSPFSESETEAIQDLATEQRFVFSISYHSYGEIVFYPWNWGGSSAPDDAVITSVAAEVASRIPRESHGTYDYGPNAALTGYSANWLYGKLGTIDFMIEVNPYPVFIPDGSEKEEIILRNMPGACYLLDRVRGPGLTGRVTEAGTGTPLSATVKILEIFSPEIEPRTSEPLYGRFYRMLQPGQYTVEVSADGYVDRILEGVAVGTEGLTTLDVALYRPTTLVYSGCAVDDDSVGESLGNGDGVVNYGETIELKVEVCNLGDSPAPAVAATLRSEDEYATVTDSLESFGEIAGGSTVQTGDDFDFVVSPEVRDGHTLTFSLTISDDLDRAWADTFSLQVAVPELEYAAWAVIDSEGDGDGIADPGETVDLFVTLVNSGGQEATAVSCLLSSDDPFLSIVVDRADFEVISAGSTGGPIAPFVITVDPQYPLPHSTQFRLDISGAAGYFRSETFSMAVGGLAEGDVTLDGAVNVLDVIFAVHKILGLVQFNPLQFSVGDLNDDGVINVLDILQIVNIILAPSQ